MALSGNELGLEICKIIGLSPEHVVEVKLEAKANAVAVVIVKRLITNEEFHFLSKYIEERYKLIPKVKG